MKKLLLFGILIIIVAPSFAQTCAQTLRLARATYEQGRLHEIEKQLENCLKGPEQGGFSKQEKQLRVQALQILCLSYIYLEEPQKADEAMLDLKRTDPYFRPNPEVDPAEFVALYNSFREDPVYRYGFKVGGNFSRPNVKELIAAVELDDDSEYKPLFAIQLGFAADVPIMLFNQKRWTLHGELIYLQNKFEIDQKESRGPSPYEEGQELLNEFEGIETQNRIALPISIEYTFMQKRFFPYVAIGVSTDYLLSSTINGERKRSLQAGVPERNEEFTPQREKINAGAAIAAGIKLPSGPGLLVFEARYVHGFTNVSSPQTALANQSFALDYGYVDPVFNISSLTLGVSFVADKHSPRKLNRRR